jgi:beta-lactamase superfamily II metal-dependent hydrolase
MEAKPAWAQSTDTYIWVFNVQRGLAIFIRTPNNWGILYDLGNTDEFSPHAFIKENLLPHINKYDNKHDLAQLVLSHPHTDHISDVEKIKDLPIGLLTCPHDHTEAASHEKFDFSVIEETSKTKAYRALYEERELPLQTILFDDNLTLARKPEYALYYINPEHVRTLHPNNDHQYGNGCSIVLYYKVGTNSILIPGDITPEALEYMVDEGEGVEKRCSRYLSQQDVERKWHYETSDQPSLKDRLAEGLSVLVAPHHGLESGYSEKLYEAIKDAKPNLVIISEKRHTGENDGCVDARYQCEDGAVGEHIDIDGTSTFCNSVSTRNGHHILIKFTASGQRYVYTRTDPKDLLNL